MLIPLPKELGFGLSKYGKAVKTRAFNVDVLKFIMAKSEHFNTEKSRDIVVRFAYMMGQKDLMYHKILPEDKPYSRYVMDAGLKLLDAETT